MRVLLLMFCFGLGLSASAQAVPQAASLRLLSEEFPPITFTQNGVPKGLAVELVEDIQRRLGQQQTIEFMPWSRAYREVQGPGQIALFTMARTPLREPLFKWVGPVVTFYSSIHAPAQGGLRLRSLEDAKRFEAVLVVRDWFTAEELTTLGFKNLVPVSDPVTALRMLLAKRAPLFATERQSMPGIMAQAGLPEESLDTVYTYASSHGYIAFSKDTPDALVKAWADQLEAMKRDGSFAAIYKRWLPKDQPPMGR